VRVETRKGEELRLNAPLIFINTGTRSRIPDVEGLADVPFLTNATIMELERTPEHLLVLGGGYIGLEFAHMFRRFGTRVTILHSHSQLLPREDEDVASEMARILRDDGIEILLSAGQSAPLATTEAASVSRSMAPRERESSRRPLSLSRRVDLPTPKASTSRRPESSSIEEATFA
jgi:pyruvate/2-oxoglutarate dehydrogenase complex dihydrolipoamide dehydrogenase (E3) component